MNDFDRAICEMSYDELSAEYSRCMTEAFKISEYSFKELAFFRDRAECIRLYVVENFLI